ncbi:mismatch repair endonuclease PMS2 [Chlorella sorokiniana]|uniref:Mismatch repair endonuclease PMS2 n=1 Tax=Chlorella sorokiniana TaxID=3076 RepID=A0A2P6TIY1_CHLSO|nr:mismatch repair endonuclease PMS2 [Chlorella sorokiniana]|eukprot:PRW39172.1 mismatch repair endonuclease PMS2 [Chlorella sorokiniana]
MEGSGGGAPPPALAAAGGGRRSAAAIKPIDREAVHRICSGQVILDLATAVKELVENALDAGATAIEIRLKEYGSELLEVADNGHGVSPDNYQALTLKYHTSKIEGFDDLQELATFGFRGEALSSLCAVADVSVVTRTAEQDVGVRLSYDHNGRLVGQAGAARTVGTTVAVRDLFKRLPVRHKEFVRHIKREYARLVGLLQAYALICTGVRLVCTNQVGNGARTTVVSTQGGRSIRDNILAVFGGKAVEGMESLEVQVDADGTAVTIAGWVSKATASSGRAAGDRQFFFLNGRPVDLPKATKALNECYRSLSSPAAAASKPMAVVDFRLPPDTFDVNVTPDKRKVFLHAEKKVLAAFTEGLQALWEPSRNTYAVNDAVATQQAQRGGSQAVAAGPRSVPAFSQFAASQAQAAGAAESEDGEDEGAAAAAPAGGASEPPAKRRAVLPLAAFALGGAGGSQAGASPASQQQTQQQPLSSQQQQQASQQQGSKQRSLLSFGFQREQLPASADIEQQQQSGGVPGQASESQLQGQTGAADAAGLAGMSREQAEQVAEQELQRVFDKADFRRLEVLGQFNLGFILARLDRDLFIIDQHASDEKHNFERLQRITTLNRQPLLAPQPLDLSPTEALTVRDNLEVFRQNGFEFRDEPGTGRLLLTAVPFSKNITFGPADVAELVSLLDSGAAPVLAVGGGSASAARSAPGAVVRPSRVRAMLASRACRSSIMIGKALHPRTMRQILDHLANLEAPWNCPHGRPTMRHLALLPPPQPPLQP